LQRVVCKKEFNLLNKNRDTVFLKTDRFYNLSILQFSDLIIFQSYNPPIFSWNNHGKVVNHGKIRSYAIKYH